MSEDEENEWGPDTDEDNTDEEMELKADLHRKYDLGDINGANQENFCN